ncbi:MAG: hypothetical protein ACREL7_13055 [Longimicrobiales bacterium]
MLDFTRSSLRATTRSSSWRTGRRARAARRPDEQYRGREICLGSNETALSIADVTTKGEPVAISRASYPNVGYAHQGWLDEQHDHNLYIVGNLMYQSNYVSGLRIVDITNRSDPREVGFFDTVPWNEDPGFDGSWSNYPFFASGTIIVTSGKVGVFMVRKKVRPVS